MRTHFFFILGLIVAVPLLAHAQSTQNFVPLTNLPGIAEFAKSPSLPNLLNNIYKICIGIAATLAVLQIMRAGIMYMGGDSVTEKKEARDLIAMSIIGLLLVLSPVIVFSIINPEILKLDINTSTLSTSPVTSDDFGAVEKSLWTDYGGDASVAKDRCTSQGGVPSYVCRPQDTSKQYVIQPGQKCGAGETIATVCKPGNGAPATKNSCDNN